MVHSKRFKFMTMDKIGVVLPIAALLISGASVAAEDVAKSAPRPSREAIIEKYDTDGDGKLDDSERNAARAEFQKRSGGEPSSQSRPPGDRSRGGAMSREDMMKKYDKNGDGQIDGKERAALREKLMKSRGNPAEGRGRGRNNVDRAALIKEFDKDGDGKLDDNERQAAMTAMRGRYKVQGAPSRSAGSKGRSEFNRDEMIKRHDKDGDGKLDEKERSALRKDIQKSSEKRRTRGEQDTEKN